jgi:hypothetical protein
LARLYKEVFVAKKEKIKKIEEFCHPGNPKSRIVGIRLEPGIDVLQRGDFYPAPDGKWEETRCTSATIPPGSAVMWVRKQPDRVLAEML